MRFFIPQSMRRTSVHVYFLRPHEGLVRTLVLPWRMSSAGHGMSIVIGGLLVKEVGKRPSAIVTSWADRARARRLLDTAQRKQVEGRLIFTIHSDQGVHIVVQE